MLESEGWYFIQYSISHSWLHRIQLCVLLAKEILFQFGDWLSFITAALMLIRIPFRVARQSTTTERQRCVLWWPFKHQALTERICWGSYFHFTMYATIAKFSIIKTPQSLHIDGQRPLAPFKNMPVLGFSKPAPCIIALISSYPSHSQFFHSHVRLIKHFATPLSLF